MASNGVDPTQGYPLFPETDAPQMGADEQEIAAYAAFRGGLLRGTSAQRSAFAYKTEGLEWNDETDGKKYKVVDGSWVAMSGMRFLGAGSTMTNPAPPAGTPIMLQTGMVVLTPPASGGHTFNFPVAFPNGVLHAWGTNPDPDTAPGMSAEVLFSSVTKTQLGVRLRKADGTPQTTLCRFGWVAIGW